MSRVKAVELVATGLQCDRVGCEVLTPTRNESSMSTPGFYFPAGGLVRVTDHGNVRTNPEELFFHSKECLLDAMKWQLSSLTR
jgi:hypothetical protein